MIQKIALFDVDKTVIQKDSMFQFMFYGLKKKPASLYMLLPVLVNSVLYKLKWMKAEHAKSAYFRWIRYMDEEDLQHFFNTKIKPYIFPEALKEMTAKKREGYHILLVTASPYAYMKYFEQLNAVDGVIGTLLTMNGSRFTHRIEGKNCKGEEKAARIQSYLAEQGMLIDYDQSCAYSDSLSDMPMLELVSRRYMINCPKQTAGCEALTWSL